MAKMRLTNEALQAAADAAREYQGSPSRTAGEAAADVLEITGGEAFDLLDGVLPGFAGMYMCDSHGEEVAQAFEAAKTEEHPPVKPVKPKIIVFWDGWPPRENKGATKRIIKEFSDSIGLSPTADDSPIFTGFILTSVAFVVLILLVLLPLWLPLWMIGSVIHWAQDDTEGSEGDGKR